MNLQELTSLPPKPWLNIIANTISSGQSYSVEDFNIGSVTNNSTVGPIVLTPAQIINGIISNTQFATTINYTLPSGADISAYIGTTAFPYLNISFKFTYFFLKPSSQPPGTVTIFTCPADTYVWPVPSQHSFQIQTSLTTFDTSHVITYVNSGSGWVIYI